MKTGFAVVVVDMEEAITSLELILKKEQRITYRMVNLSMLIKLRES